MEPELVPVETPGGITPEAPAEPSPADSSIAAHIASLTPEPVEGEETPPVRQDRKHRVKDIARPADVPRIRELSSKLKEREAEAAEWRAKYEALSKAPAPVAQPVAEPKPVPIASAAVAAEKFTFDSFDVWERSHPGASYEDWSDAKLDARDAWREKLQQQKTAAEREEQTRTAAQEKEAATWRAVDTTFEERRQAFIKTNPDYDTKLQALGNAPLSPLMVVAIKKLDNGPALAYSLFSRPDLIAEAHLLGEGRPITDAAVASAQRWLQSRVPTGPTGAVAAIVPKVLPHPPTPVRTGPETPSEQPPGDDAGLAAHKRFYGESARR